MWKLAYEIREALTSIFQQEKYQKVLNLFLDKNSRQFSAISYILSEKENECLMRILADLQTKVGVKALTLVFDGAIVSC